jgi:addiction module HigA family antidote
MKKKQNSFSPNYAVPPGETLGETLNALGMTQAELGRRTGQSHKLIKEIVSGKKAISAEMAFKLDHVLKVPASFWINLEKNYQKTITRLRGGKKWPRLI